MRSATRRAWPPRAERAVDDGLARLRVERLDQLAGQDRDVLACHVKQDGQRSAMWSAALAIRSALCAFQVVRVPQLEAVARADHLDVLA